jgi:predicted membrane-bound spermidine synthase
VHYPRPVLYAVFFLSGIAALLYQLLWQRALFGIYGTNTESVTIVVAAFMLGLGLGSLTGGRLSRKPPLALPLLFGLLELLIGLYGLGSLDLFYLVGEHTAGASVWMAGVLTFAMVAFPTCLMGATLPILVAYAVKQTGNVGKSVGSLYFVNTIGSAIGCFVAAVFLFRVLGMRGSILAAAGVNALAAAIIVGIWFVRRRS